MSIRMSRRWAWDSSRPPGGFDRRDGPARLQSNCGQVSVDTFQMIPAIALRAALFSYVVITIQTVTSANISVSKERASPLASSSSTSPSLSYSVVQAATAATAPLESTAHAAHVSLGAPPSMGALGPLLSTEGRGHGGEKVSRVRWCTMQPSTFQEFTTEWC